MVSDVKNENLDLIFFKYSKNLGFRIYHLQSDSLDIDSFNIKFSLNRNYFWWLINLKVADLVALHRFKC